MIATTGSTSSAGHLDLRTPECAPPPPARPTPPGHPPTFCAAQEGFNNLIRQEAFGAFAEAFAAHQAVQRAQAEADGHTFTSSLTLQLPSGWTTSAPAAMEQVFSRLRVDRLDVVRPAGGATQAVAWVSEPVCGAIVALLKSGLRDLRLQVALEADVRVAAAIAASPHLVSIELEDPLLRRHLAPEEVETQRCVITHGVLRCASLQHVALHHHELVRMLQMALVFPPKKPPAWRSMVLRFCEADVADAEPFFARLDVFLKKFPVLAAMDLSVSELDA